MDVFDLSNPAMPTRVYEGTVGVGGSLGLVVRGHFVYATHNGSPGHLNVIDVSNPAGPVAYGSSPLALGGNFTWGLAMQGSYVYVVNYSSNTMQVVNVANPAAPSIITPTPVATGTQPTSVAVQGHLAYVTNYGDGTVQAYDITNPASPQSLGTINVGGHPQSIYVVGRYGYITNNGSNTLQVIDLGGIYTQQFQAGGAEVGTLQVDSSANFAGDASVQGALNVGQRLQVTGDVGMGGQVLLQSSTDSTTAFRVQNSAGTNLILADTNSMVISSAGTLSIQGSGNNTFSGTLTVGSGGNTVTLSAASGLMAAGTARHTKNITLAPEYANAVLDAASDPSCSSASTGTMTAGFDSTNRMNFYNWVSGAAATNCYDVIVQVPIPSDWDGWSGSPTLYVYNSAGTNSTSVYVEAIGSNGTVDTNYGGYVAVSSGTTLNAATLTGLDGTNYSAGGYMTLKIRLSSPNTTTNVRIGNISLNYYSKF